MRTFMMRIFSLILLITCVLFQHSSGQSITGDTIFVNSEAEIAIKFPSKLSNFYTAPNNAPYNLKSISTGLTISSKSENTKPAFLFVTEGGRTHRIVLAYKKNINYDDEAELFFDYGTLKKLEQHVAELAARKKTGPVPAEVKTAEVKNNDQNTVAGNNTATESPAEAEDSYNALLEEGDKYMKLGLYKEAKLIFENAHNLRSDDIIPTQRIEEIQLKLNNNEVLAEIEKNKKYIELTEAAKTEFDQKNYKEAQDGYRRALALKPNDLYATRQLEKIDQALYDESQRQERLKLQETYKSYISNGEIAFNQNNLPNARNFFEQALLITPNDPLAQKRIAAIQAKEQDLRQKDTASQGGDYESLITEADKAFQAGDYTTGKALYNKALLLSKQPKAKEQISRIDKLVAAQTKDASDKKTLAKKEADDKKEREAQELENNYSNAIQAADKLYNAGNLAEAKLAYNKAIQVINRPWPNDQITKINIHIAEQVLKERNEKQQLALRLEKEKRDQEALELENKYSAAIEAADKLYRDGNLTEAKITYNSATQLINRPWPKEQITKINTLIAEQTVREKNEKQQLALRSEKEKRDQEALELENKYSAGIQTADKLYNDGNLTEAKVAYTRAGQMIDRPWPKEQITKINTLIAEQTLREKNDKQQLALRLEKEKRDQETLALENKYTAAIQAADKLYNEGNLSDAKLAYNKAGQLLNRPWPKEQIIKIDTLIAEQTLREKNEKQQLALKLEQAKKEKEALIVEDKYSAAILVADNFFKAGDYTNAKPAYKAALNIIKKTWPEEQLKNITKIEADLVAKEIADRPRIAQEKIAAKYKLAIEAADTEFDKGDFIKARKLYTDAAAIIPAETRPKERLNYIQTTLDRIAAEEKEKKQTIAAETELRKKYDNALAKAKVYYQKDDLVNAQTAYTEAATLIPGETEPQNQLKIISDTLAEIARQNEINQRYESKIAFADSLLIAKRYEPAIGGYQDALIIKPSEVYPDSQIKYIQAEVEFQKTQKEQRDKLDANNIQIEKRKKYRHLVILGDKSVAGNNLETAKQQYTEALNLQPQDEYAKQRLKIVDYQLDIKRNLAEKAKLEKQK
ncbi:MAG: hypothetical protein ABIN67_04870 [Ferruginibacter sp.]